MMDGLRFWVRGNGLLKEIVRAFPIPIKRGFNPCVGDGTFPRFNTVLTNLGDDRLR